MLSRAEEKKVLISQATDVLSSSSLHFTWPCPQIESHLLSSDYIFTLYNYESLHWRSTFLEISSKGQWPFSLLFSRCHAIKLLLFYCDCTWHTGLHNAKYRMHKYTNTQILPQILPLHIAYRVAHCKIQNAH